MTQTKLSTKPVAQIGEEIGLELGTQMVKSYQDANPNCNFVYTIGRNIISEILSQPNCEGIKLYDAFNETGEKTLVLVGIDANHKAIIEIPVVSSNGQLDIQKGIVADRIGSTPVKVPSTTRIGDDQDWFEFD